MSVAQRIAAITAALTALEHAIAQTEAALNLAMTLNDIARLNQQLVTLKAKRTQLQFELINLQAAQTGIAPMGGLTADEPAKLTGAQSKSARALAKKLSTSSSDRRMVEASLLHADDVLDQVAALQVLLTGKKAG